MQIDRVSNHKPRVLAQKRIMLPAEHGAWIFLFSPLAIGLVTGGRLTLVSVLLVLAALAAFLLRQPLTIAVKAVSGRRPRSDMGAAWFWMAIYGLVGLAALAGLFLLGYSYIFLLAVPAVPVLAWHLWLVSKRAERHQMAVELAGSAVLALVAPAAYWIGKGHSDLTGWLLWGLSWLQIAGSIVYTYLRLKQRRLSTMPEPKESLKMGLPALVFNTALFILSILLSVFAITPPWVPVAYAVQWLEVLWGILHPAVRAKPAAIGMRQLAVSGLFTLIFILAWI